MNPSFALGQRSWCPHYPCSERRCWATPWGRGAGWTQPCVKRPHLITHRTDPERGPRRDVRRAPGEKMCRVRLLRTGSRRRGSGGRKRRGGWVSVSDPSWPCLARLPCKSPGKSAKCPCDPSLLPRRFAPLPLIPARCARLRVPQNGGSPRRERFLLHLRFSQGSPLPIHKERHRARRALEELGSGEGGKEGSKGLGRQERLPDAGWGASVPRAGLEGWRVGASPTPARVWKEVRLCRKRAGEGQRAWPLSFTPLPWGLGARLRTLYLLA